MLKEDKIKTKKREWGGEGEVVSLGIYTNFYCAHAHSLNRAYEALVLIDSWE